MQVTFGEYLTASLMHLIGVIPWDQSPRARKLSNALLQSSVSINNFTPREDIPYNQEGTVYILKTPQGVTSRSVKRCSCVPYIYEHFERFLFYISISESTRDFFLGFFFNQQKAKTEHSCY